MTWEELENTLFAVATNYNRPLDDYLITLWKDHYLGFDAECFKIACRNVMVECKFFPNAKEIVDAYRDVVIAKRNARDEKIRERQLKLVAEQAYCYWCDNEGICAFSVDGHEYYARCICSHGNDIDKFSEAQISRKYIPEKNDKYSERENSAIRRGENPLYVKNIKEALGDDFIIFDVTQKDKYLSRNAKTEDEKIALLRNINRFFDNDEWKKYGSVV